MSKDIKKKKDTVMNALNSLSKRMNPNLVRSGSLLIVALDRKSKPMRGFFITEKRNKGYLVILDNDRYTVQSSSTKDAKIELAKLVKPNLSKRKKMWCYVKASKRQKQLSELLHAFSQNSV